MSRDPAALIGKLVGSLGFRHRTPFATRAQKNHKNEEVVSICLDYFLHGELKRKKNKERSNINLSPVFKREAALWNPVFF